MVARVFRAIRTPLTLLILLGVLGYGAYWGWNNVIAPAPPLPPKPCVPTKVVKGKLTAAQVTVRVFNGGQVRGLAGDVANSLRGKGFNTSAAANTSQKVATTIVVGAKKTNPEVKLVASFFKGASIREDGRKDGTVDVLVGDKYGGFNSKAQNWIAVKTQTVCLSSPITNDGS